MRVQVVGSAAGGAGFPLSTFVIDGKLAVDAGALGWFDTPDRQAAVRDILLTHCHIDHVAGLPVFLDTVYRLTPEPPTVYAAQPTLQALRDHLFNDCLMPDFIRLGETLPPFVRVCPILPGRPFAAGAYLVTAVELEHIVPTVGYLIDDGTDAVAVLTDTAPIPALFAEVARTPRLKAVFLEASFPDALPEIAAISKHMTAGEFLAAARQFPEAVNVYAIHVKPRFFAEIAATIRAEDLPNVRVAEPGQVIEVGGR